MKISRLKTLKSQLDGLRGEFKRTDFFERIEQQYSIRIIMFLIDSVLLGKDSADDDLVLDSELVKLENFLANRWELIRGTSLAYTQNLYYIVNRICLLLAEALAAEKKGRNRYQILMPTLENVAEITGTDLSDKSLCLSNFVLSDDQTRIIEIIPCLDCAQNDGVLKHTSLFDGNVRCLSPTEITRLLDSSLEAKAYYDAIKLHHKKRNNFESLGGMLNYLISGLRAGGSHRRQGSGKELNAGAEANQAIVIFIRYFDSLSPANQDLLFNIEAGGESLKELISRLRNPTDYKKVKYCVELIADGIETVLEANPKLYDIRPMSKTTDAELILFFERSIHEKRRNLVKISNQFDKIKRKSSDQEKKRLRDRFLTIAGTKKGAQIISEGLLRSAADLTFFLQQLSVEKRTNFVSVLPDKGLNQIIKTNRDLIDFVQNFPNLSCDILSVLGKDLLIKLIQNNIGLISLLKQLGQIENDHLFSILGKEETTNIFLRDRDALINIIDFKDYHSYLPTSVFEDFFDRYLTSKEMKDIVRSPVDLIAALKLIPHNRRAFLLVMLGKKKLSSLLLPSIKETYLAEIFELLSKHARKNLISILGEKQMISLIKQGHFVVSARDMMRYMEYFPLDTHKSLITILSKKDFARMFCDEKGRALSDSASALISILKKMDTTEHENFLFHMGRNILVKICWSRRSLSIVMSVLSAKQKTTLIQMIGLKQLERVFMATEFNLRENGKYPCLIVGGDGCSGKSSLLVRFLDDSFYPETYNVESACFGQQHTLPDGNRVVLLDLQGQEDYDRLNATFIGYGEIFILVYSITSTSSFDNIIPRHASVIRKIHGENAPIILVGNKCDLEDERKVTKKMLKEKATEIGAISYFETSAKTGKNLDAAFQAAINVMYDRKRKKRVRFELSMFESALKEFDDAGKLAIFETLGTEIFQKKVKNVKSLAIVANAIPAEFQQQILSKHLSAERFNDIVKNVKGCVYLTEAYPDCLEMDFFKSNFDFMGGISFYKAVFSALSRAKKGGLDQETTPLCNFGLFSTSTDSGFKRGKNLLLAIGRAKGVSSVKQVMLDYFSLSSAQTMNAFDKLLLEEFAEIKEIFLPCRFSSRFGRSQVINAFKRLSVASELVVSDKACIGNKI